MEGVETRNRRAPEGVAREKKPNGLSQGEAVFVMGRE
jgi:hypothetical protein